jgi:hypothetical protein
MFLNLFRSDCVGLYRGEALVCPLGAANVGPIVCAYAIVEI